VVLTTDLYLVSGLDCTGHGTVRTYDQINLTCHFDGVEEGSYKERKECAGTAKPFPSISKTSALIQSMNEQTERL
jgi:hypothetical protein